MKALLATLALVGVLTMADEANAENYSLTGFGTRSCSSWSAFRMEHSRETVIFEQWVLGYISGVKSTYVDNNKAPNPLRGLDARVIWALVDSSCQDNPDAGLELIAGLVVSKLEHPR